MRAISPEDDTHSVVTSTALILTVNKLSTNISCAVSPFELVEGNEMITSGSLNPAMHGVTVTLRYAKPDDSTVTRSVTTGSDGSFSDTFSPDDVGVWIVVASWNGDATYQEASSTSFTVTISEQGLQISPIAIGIPILLGLIAVIVIISRRR